MKTIMKLFIYVGVILSVYSQNTIVEEFTLKVNNEFQLSGEIEYPNKVGKFPAAIFIWGSGPHTRDETISGTPIFKLIKDELVKEDMVVLRMDKRGYGKSTGDFKSEVNYTTRDLADDIHLAYELLNNHKAVDTSKVGLIGHSEGSIIASMLGAENPSIDWIVVFGPSATSGKEIELAQRKINLANRDDISKEVSSNILHVFDKYIEFIKNGYADDEEYYSIGKAFLMAHGLKENDERITNKFIDQLLDGFKTKWYQYFYRNDNSDHIRKINVPYLAIMGGEDQHTSIDLHFTPLNQALKASGNKNYKIAIIADDDHFFIRHRGQRVTKHRNGEMEISKPFINTLISWLKEESILPELGVKKLDNALYSLNNDESFIQLPEAKNSLLMVNKNGEITALDNTKYQNLNSIGEGDKKVIILNDNKNLELRTVGRGIDKLYILGKNNEQITWIIDGKKIESNKLESTLRNLNPNSIKEIKKISSEEAKSLFGIKAKHGALIIETRR